MRHYCTACSSEFADDGGPLPNSDAVHCVFCGARIALPPPGGARAPASVVPFSPDYAREEAFALGVITGSGPGFPDTLRQFRVPAAKPGSDSLSPLVGRSEPPRAPPLPAPRRLASLSLSLAVGFGVGVAIAFGAVSLRKPGVEPHAAAPVLRPRPTPRPSALAAAPAPIRVEPQTPSGAAPSAARRSTAPTPHVKTGSSHSSSPALERRWLLQRARGEQRQYRLVGAEHLYRQVLAHAPRDSEALSGLGELELLRGTVELAAARFQEALSANSDYIPALIAAADLRWQAGSAEEAREAYRNIVEHYSADSYPPYVALRAASDGAPQCVP